MNRAVPEKTEILLRYGDLAALPGFRVLRFDGGGAAEGFSSVSIDSRTVRPGALFAALAGSEADGHAFVAGAFLRGAAAALVDETKIARYDLENAARKSGAVLVALGDTLWGLQEAARVYLARFPRLLKIAVTGSSGKTTVKEIAAAMIGAEKNVFFNEGNLNSETGLPLSVFGVRSFHEAGVFEMGMNRRGEIAALARVLEPHIALITNIGPAHIGYIGSIAAIVEEKKAVFSRFTGTETALVPEDEPYREDLARGVRGNVVYYGPRSLEDLGDVFDRGLDGAEITWEGVSAPFSLPGKHNLKNAFAAMAIAKAAGVTGRAVREGLRAARPLFGRSEILRLPAGEGGGITVIRDCYNANPASVAAAVAFADALQWPGRRIYVIGSMLELGEATAAAHEELGRILAASRADRVFFFGEETAAARDVYGASRPGAFYAASIGELSRALAELVRGGDLLLLKGSRLCALERVLDALPGGNAETAEARA